MKKLIVITWIIGGAMSLATAYLFALYGAHCWETANGAETAPFGLIADEFYLALLLNVGSICFLQMVMSGIREDAGTRPLNLALSELRYGIKYFPDEAVALFLLRKRPLFFLVLLVPIAYLFVAGVTFFVVQPIAEMVDYVRNITSRRRSRRYYFI